MTVIQIFEDSYSAPWVFYVLGARNGNNKHTVFDLRNSSMFLENVS